MALSILLGSLWVRGRYVSDTARVDGGSGLTLHAFSGHGSGAVAVTTGGDYFKSDKDGKKPWRSYSAARPPIDFHARWAGLGAETRYNRGGFVVIREPSRGTVFGVLVPYATVAPALLGLAVVRVAWYRLYSRPRRRIRAGLCPDCGHEMRSLAERCANCGRKRTRGEFRIGRVKNAEPARRAA